MSWLNSSFNTIKGQLSNLAQEVLAETAGPGDAEYREDISEINTKTAVDLLAETQKQKEQLDTLCDDKDREIAALRKQITNLQNQLISDSGGGVGVGVGAGGKHRTGSKSPTADPKQQQQQQQPNELLEDSWCWEPDNATTSSDNGNEMVTISLACADEAAASDQANNNKQEMAALQSHIQRLEAENRRLNNEIEELDNQHTVAMQDVLELKAELQVKLSELSKAYDALKQEQADRFISNELAMAKIQKEHEQLQRAQQSAAEEKQAMQFQIDDYAAQLQKASKDSAELGALLEKKSSDNAELIERIRQLDDQISLGCNEREELVERIDALEKELQDLRALKEKKTSESSTSSSTGKQSEDEFIVVREGDASSSGPATPPTNDKLEQLERRVAELTVENGSLRIKMTQAQAEQQESTEAALEQLADVRQRLQTAEKQLEEQRQRCQELQKSIDDERVKSEQNVAELEFRLRTSEDEKEQLQLNLQAMRAELESKAQRLTMENQQLKLNAEAEQETLNNSAELEDKLKVLAEENDTLRNELEASIAQAKFRQAIAEEKQKITDLDADVEEDPFKLDKVRDLLAAFVHENLSDTPQETLERSYKALRERLNKIESLEKSLGHVSEEITELQDNKLLWDHEKKTLEADISQYILQCEELMKNNEILLTELENFKRNKLETINENHEETIIQLETQLEECTNMNRSLEQEYNGLNEKYADMERELGAVTAKWRETQAANEQLVESERKLQLRLESLEQDKSNLHFELTEAKASSEQEETIAELQSKCEQLNAQLARMSKDHAELVNAMQQQQATLLESNTKRDALEQELAKLIGQLQAAELSRTDESANVNRLANLQHELAQLRAELSAKDIVTGSLKEATHAAEQQHAELARQLKDTKDMLRHKEATIETLQSELASLAAKQAQYETDYAQLQARCDTQSEELAAPTPTQHDAVARIAQLEAELLATADLKKNVETLSYERGEMIKALQQKHVENMQYYQEIQRLQPLVAAAAAVAEQKPCEECATLRTASEQLRKEREKLLDQINFLKEKSDILTTNLLTEQTNQKLIQHEKTEVLEQNATLHKDLARLREHLLEVEELHTQETMQLERVLEETKANMLKLQADVSKSSNAYTSASIRANQHAETLQAQYALVVQQRDELASKLSWCEDRESRNQAALTNLQCALEQFQNDKENEIKAATQRIRKELQLELDKETALQAELAALQQQLNDANQGLRAASRLSDQLEAAQQTIAVLREEIDGLKASNAKLEQQLSTSELSQTDKIEKNLIKSLLIGYVVSGSPNDKQQVLRMISSVLDFTAQESDKVGLNKQQSSWLGSLLGGAGAGAGVSMAAQGAQARDNLVQAFVQFLEQESQPQTETQRLPVLLTMATTAPTTTTTAATPIATTTTATTPSEHLPAKDEENRLATTSPTSNAAAATGIPIQSSHINSAEFVPTRNSSTILKDILNDS